MQKKLLICVPAYNEEESLGGVLDNILGLPMREIFDVLVVNDGSEDDTEQICRSRGVSVITHIFNSGYGAALKTAYKYASEREYEYIIQLDADGQHDLCNIENIYEKLTAPDSTPPDIVIASRFLKGSVSFYIPPYKKLVILILNAMIFITTKRKITDPTSGLQGLTRRTFCFYAGFNRFATDYPDANMVIQMVLNNFKVEEIPAVMHPRLKGVSMHSGIYKPVKYVVKMMLSITGVFIRESLAARKARKSSAGKAKIEFPVPEHSSAGANRE